MASCANVAGVALTGTVGDVYDLNATSKMFVDNISCQASFHTLKLAEAIDMALALTRAKIVTFRIGIIEHPSSRWKV